MEQEIDGSGGVENGRRRRWTLEEKRAVVELSLDPACSMAEVAACFDVLPAQIYAWRRELREMAADPVRARQFLLRTSMIASQQRVAAMTLEEV